MLSGFAVTQSGQRYLAAPGRGIDHIDSEAIEIAPLFPLNVARSPSEANVPECRTRGAIGVVRSPCDRPDFSLAINSLFSIPD
jgi:hypothetical protein